MTSTNTRAYEQGRVVLNAGKDTDEFSAREMAQKNPRLRNAVDVIYSNPTGDHDLHVLTGEVCLANRSKPYGRDNGRVTAYSSLNGMFVRDEKDPRRRDIIAPRVKKRKHLAFAGIAHTTSMYSKNPSKNERGLVLQLGGINTTINTGDEDINAGDEIMWDLPEPGYKLKTSPMTGIPSTKVVPMTKVLRPSDVPHLETVKKVLGIEKTESVKSPSEHPTEGDYIDGVSKEIRNLILLAATVGASLKCDDDVSAIATEFGLVGSNPGSLRGSVLGEPAGEWTGAPLDKVILKSCMGSDKDHVHSDRNIKDTQINSAKMMIQYLQEAWDDIQSRRIGKATTSGAVGKPFDIILSNYIS